jgi:hypothetical protein
MKRSVYRFVGPVVLKGSASVGLSLLVAGAVVAGVPGPADTLAAGKHVKQPRIVGKKAVMHVYSYAPKTLEITSVTSHFFKDVAACERAVGSALATAASHESGGDLVEVQCVAVDRPDALAQREAAPRSVEVTKL